jgi:hypothetical protein
MPKSLLFFATLFALYWNFSCSPAPAEKDSPLLSYFKRQPLADTARFELEEGTDNDPGGDTIPNALFFKELGVMMTDIDYLADSMSATVMGKYRFELNKRFDACLVDIHQNWFKNQSLLVYDKHLGKFTQRITLAEWYGGESGQILTGSWLLDYNGDHQKDLVTRFMEHSSIFNADTDEVKENMNESASLALWQKGSFVSVPVKDTAALIKRFPIKSVW